MDHLRDESTLMSKTWEELLNETKLHNRDILELRESQSCSV